MKDLLDKGELGKLQFVQASHQQDMDGWPNYWPGLPPMWYATHCVGPVAGLVGQPAEYVSCFGSGTIRKELIAVLRFSLRCRDCARQVPRKRCQCADHPQSLRHGAAVSREHRRLRNEEDHRVAADRARAARVAHAPSGRSRRFRNPSSAPISPAACPRPSRNTRRRGVYDASKKTHLSFTQGSGHGGSHPHLAHEFAMALVEDRDPFPNAVQSANWTCVGLCASVGARRRQDRQTAGLHARQIASARKENAVSWLPSLH